MNLDTPGRKTAAVLFSLLAIAIAGGMIWWQYRPRRPADTLPQYAAAGQILAEETVKSIAHRPKKRVLVVSAKNPDAAMQLEHESFMAVLKQHPEIEIKGDERLEAEGKNRFTVGQGLSARKFVRLVEHNLKADAIVSFVGMPKPDDKDLAALNVKVPRVLAMVADRDRVEGLFTNKMLRVAIVPRFQFPSPVKEPKTPQEHFDKHYQILRAPKSTNTAETADEPGKAKAAEKEE